MKRKHKKYSRPKRPFEKGRIEEERTIKKAYGLKNKKEIWKAEAGISSIRSRAKKLISASPKEQGALFERLKKLGLKAESISDILSLDKKDYLNRRLQTIVLQKKIATTTKMARQLITHGKILIKGRVVNSPSYIVPIELEEKITLRKKLKKQKEVKVEESKNE